VADNTSESQRVEWDSLNSFDLGSVRDELEDSAAALPRADDLDHGPHPEKAGITERVTVGPRAGADARQADAQRAVMASQTRQPMRVRSKVKQLKVM